MTNLQWMATAVTAAWLFAAGFSRGDEIQTKGPKAPGSIIGRRIPNFVLPDAAGKQVGLADFKDSRLVVVVLIGSKCSIGNAYVPVLQELHKEFGAKVEFLGICSHADDTAPVIGRHVKDYKIAFPLLVDAEQSVSGLFGAQRLGAVFVLDQRRVVRYSGRIDDRIGYNYQRDKPRRFDLREAILELLGDQRVSVATTEVAGCLLTPRQARPAKGTTTYAQHVAPILYKHCAECHHPGTAAPFSLLSYKDAAAWAAMIREVVVQRRMPPWHADSRFGRFHNERRLSQDEIDTLVRWADDGAPQGNPKDAPKTPQFADGWRIGKPDHVFRMPQEFSVPAKGAVNYQIFVGKTKLKEDLWVQAAEVRPGNRRAVHHVIVGYKAPGPAALPIWIASTVPGGDAVILPAGLGRRIPAGSELVWEVHYVSTGKQEKDRSEIGLVLCKTPPKHDVMTHGIMNTRLCIPAGAANHEVIAEVPAFKDAVLLGILPHMHLRGKNFECQAIHPDGRREVLLSIPQYDTNWQHTYRFKRPVPVPKGTIIRCVAHFDNSSANPANPDPTQVVHWGKQTWEEMMIGYLDFYWNEPPNAGADNPRRPGDSDKKLGPSVTRP